MNKNIFELAAEAMEEEQHKAYLGYPASMKYLLLSTSTDSKIIGRKWPQTDYIDLSLAHQLKYHNLHPGTIAFDKIELYKSSKLTDLISTAAISAHAFVLSKKALDVFRYFKLGNHKIYPATVYHKQNAHEYGILHFVNDLHGGLDFSKSKFYVANLLGGYEFDIDVTDEEDYKNKQQLVKTAQYPNTKKWWFVRLKWGVFKKGVSQPDIFNISSSNIEPYVSYDLAQAVVENGLTGFEFKRAYNLQD
ncbi:hypothetical protein [Adhaeribacter soli]|uniref:Immunity protein 43 domain-containing protein n=1 Tax=Adhaeribacter soli TaxID=2607655 RepID=A0A5N1J5C1_9BACT|nr:hypothetical protein [Adhaeribacter soli]KAA9345890.1 hypothetical protein F0P94_02065 [Adhaeribacter soli]